MDNNALASYSLDELIDMLDDTLDKAVRFPFGKKDLVDVGKMTEIVYRIRRLIPEEIDDAKHIVSDRTAIIEKAKQEAAAIIKDAEARRKQILDHEDIMREAHTRANEIITAAQKESNSLYAAANQFADTKLATLENVLSKDLADIHMLRTNLAGKSGQPQQVPPQKTVQPAPAPRPAQPAAPKK
ncbi:MAG: hypothetical protein KIG62_07035 [Oscillospiraceae bacterium]|nr:hypothetical protein [Oscillospiraceae bacterium]